MNSFKNFHFLRSFGQWLGYGLNIRGILSWILTEARDLSLLRIVQTDVQSTQHGVQKISGYIFSTVNWPEHEAAHLPLSTAELKNVWSSTSSSPVTSLLVKLQLYFLFFTFSV